MKQHLRRQPEMHSRGIRPALRPDLITHIGPHIAASRSTPLRSHHRQVPSLMQQIAGIQQLLRIDHQPTVLQRHTWKKAVVFQRSQPHGEPDLAQKRSDRRSFTLQRSHR
jgi:hypothetical protein